jgi:hypothetical protein
MVLNKVLPPYLCEEGGAEVAARLHDGASGLSEQLQDRLPGADVSQVARVLHEVGGSYLDYRVVAQRQAEQQAELATVPETLVSVPYFDTDVYDLAGLLRLGERLWGD